MTDNQKTPDPLPSRVRELLTDAVNRLDRRDYAERVSYCQATGRHGTTMHFDRDDHIVEFRWGGKTLALIDHALLLADEPLPTPDLIAEPPDTVPDNWSDQ